MLSRQCSVHAGLHVAQVTANMMDYETVYVETATGPGGLAGPLRVDIKGAHCSNPLQVGYYPSRGPYVWNGGGRPAHAGVVNSAVACH